MAYYDAGYLYDASDSIYDSFVDEPATRWVVEIDLNRNQAYDHADADITRFVLDAQWTSGFQQALIAGALANPIAPPARLQLTIDNSGGEWLPEQSSTYGTALAKRCLIRIRAFRGVNAFILYEGRIYSSKIEIGEHTEKQVAITCQDAMYELLDADFTIPYAENIRTDEALQLLFDTPGVLAYPYSATYWILDSPTYSALGTTTVLWGTNPSEFDPGVSTLVYVGTAVEETARSSSAQQFIRDVVVAEAGGRFFYDARSGRFVFHSRHHDTINPTVTQTFSTNDFTAVEYRYGEEIVNDLSIDYYPRALGTPNSAIYTQPDSVKLDRGKPKVVTVSYKTPDTEGARLIGAKDFVTPVRNVHYTINTKSDGSGADRSKDVIAFVEFGAKRAKASFELFSKRGLRRVFLTSFVLRGTPVYSFDKEQVRSVEAESIGQHERRPMALTMNYVSDSDFAQDYADQLVGLYKDALGRFENVSLSTDGGAGGGCIDSVAMLARSVGDRIAIGETISGNTADYIIVGEQHRLEPGGSVAHNVTWILTPAGRTDYWRLSDGTAFTDQSVLGDTTRLAF